MNPLSTCCKSDYLPITVQDIKLLEEEQAVPLLQAQVMIAPQVQTNHPLSPLLQQFVDGLLDIEVEEYDDFV